MQQTSNVQLNNAFRKQREPLKLSTQFLDNNLFVPAGAIESRAEPGLCNNRYIWLSNKEGTQCIILNVTVIN